MRIVRTNHSLRSYQKAPEQIQRVFEKQTRLLLQDLKHPSLRAKKFDQGQDLWQARVTLDWRFYFTIDGDAYVLHEIRSHPK